MAIVKGATLKNLKPYEDTVNKNKKIVTPKIKPPNVTKTVTKVSTPTVETPVISDLERQRQENARKDRERYEADKALAAEYAARGEVEPTRVSFEERKRRQSESSGKTEDPVKQEAARDFAAEARAAELDRIKAAFDNALGVQKEEIGAARKALVPEFRTERSRIGVEDTMSRTAADKLAATQGLAGAGSMAQTDIAQSVITGGALGASRQRESDRRAELDRLEQQAIREAEFGKAQAEAGASIQELQAMATKQENQRLQAIKDAEVNSEREYEQLVREYEQTSEESLLRLKNELEQDNAYIDAEIKEALAANDFERTKELEGIKAQNDVKLQGIRDANAMARVQAGTDGNLAEIAARGEETRRTEELKGQLKDEDEPIYSNTAVNKALSNAIESSKQRFEQANANLPFGSPTTQYGDIETQNAVKQFLLENVDNLTSEQGQEIMFKYDINPEELSRALGGN